MPASTENHYDTKHITPYIADNKSDMRGKEFVVPTAKYFRDPDNANTTITQSSSHSSFRAFVESTLRIGCGSYLDERTAKTYVGSCRNTTNDTAPDDERDIRRWLAALIAGGVKTSTAARYLGKLHTIYNQYTGSPDQGEALFAELRSALQQPIATDFVHAATIRHIKSMSGHLTTLDSDRNTAARALLYLLCSGQFDLRAAVVATVDNIPVGIGQVAAIASDQTDPRRKYLFALQQGRQRMPQIMRRLSADIATLLSSSGCTSAADINSDTLRGWWIECALACNIDLEVIRTIAGIPPSHRWLSLITPVEVDDATRTKALRTVADSMYAIAPQWYALNLRSKHTVAEIRTHLDNEHPALARDVKYFYPTRRIVRLAGKKRVTVDEPLLPGILFVRAIPDRIAPIVSTISHLAWCYKTTNTPGAPYAVIADRQMTAFRHAIGAFDTDTQLTIASDPALKPGRIVRITGGPLAGYEGEIIDQDHSDADLHTFVLRIANNVTLMWHARIPGQYLRPL